MRAKVFGSAIALSCAAAAAATACGDDTTIRTTEPCTPGQAECVDGSQKLARSCPSSADPKEAGWVYFSCSDGETCNGGACEGACTPGTKECASDELGRVCSSEGTQWVSIACEIGTTCVDGDCVPSAADAGGIQICEPGARACATDTVAKICQDDGTGWIVDACADGETCNDGDCVPNANAECIPGSTSCFDDSTMWVCNDDGTGFDAQDCGDLSCSGSKCSGPVCTPGETKCEDPVQAFLRNGKFSTDNVFQCNDDGTGWNVISCDVGSYCKWDSLTDAESRQYVEQYLTWYEDSQIGDFTDPPSFVHPSDRLMKASCYEPKCNSFPSGSSSVDVVCGPGDPAENDGSMDYDFFSRCMGLLPFSEIDWVEFQCAAPEICNPSNIQTYYGSDLALSNTDICDTECIPGEAVCDSTFGGRADAVRVCGDDGKWMTPESCNPGSELGRICHQFYPENPTDIRDAKCMDVACDYALNHNAEYYGVCEGDQIRLCDQDGMLAAPADAVDCDAGVCQTTSTADNTSVGFCASECQDGERICLYNESTYSYYGYYYGLTLWGDDYYGVSGGAGQSNVPLFVECENGVWNVDFQVCPNDELCFNVPEVPGFTDHNDIICGGVCQPGDRQCSEEPDTEAIQTCTEDGQWSDAVDCAVGVCQNESGGAFADARCVNGCVAGRYSCGPAPSVDGGGDTQAHECQADTGLYETGGEICQPDDFCNADLGCYECWGPTAADGYNSLPEAYCQDAATIVRCADDNRFVDPESCGVGYMCVQVPTDTGHPSAYCTKDVNYVPPDAGDAG